MPDNKNVELVVWGAEEDETLLRQIIERFQEEYKAEANFNITFAAQSEAGCKDALLADLEAGADVFAFADDQLNALVAAGALKPIENADQLKVENLPGAIEAASGNGFSGSMFSLPFCNAVSGFAILPSSLDPSHPNNAVANTMIRNNILNLLPIMFQPLILLFLY